MAPVPNPDGEPSLDTLKALAAKQPGSYRVQSTLGQALFDAGQFDAARDSLERAAALAPMARGDDSPNSLPWCRFANGELFDAAWLDSFQTADGAWELSRDARSATFDSSVLLAPDGDDRCEFELSICRLRLEPSSVFANESVFNERCALELVIAESRSSVDSGR